MLSKRFSRIACAAALLLFFFLVLHPAAADEFELVKDDYIFDGEYDIPYIFIHPDPPDLENGATKAIIFEEGAVLETETDFDFGEFEAWEDWHEAGADTGETGHLTPISALTIGNSGFGLTLKENARLINTGEADGLSVIGSADILLENGAVAHGSWAGIALENLEPSSHVNIINAGTIGTFTDDPENGETAARQSEFGIWVNGMGPDDYLLIENHGEIDSINGSVHVEGGAGDIDITNTGFITSGNVGVAIGTVRPEYIWLMSLDYMDLFSGSFDFENEGTVSGDAIGIDVLGDSAGVAIVNLAGGIIEGGDTAIRVFGAGEASHIENHGRISASETGISVFGGTVNIENRGEISGSADGDAIIYDGGAKGGEITLYSGVAGAIRHLGDTGDTALFIMDGGEDASVDDIALGEGSITQDSGTSAWSFGGDVTARTLRLHSGEAGLGGAVSIGDAITVEENASLSVSGADIEAKDLLIDPGAGFDFDHGSITINGGTFDYGAGPLTLSGQSENREARLHLKDGEADTGGIDVAEHGRLGGTGTVEGNVSANAGGTLQPGDPTGPLSITGDLTVDGGATVNIRIKGGDDNCGELDVTGNADIGDGVTLRIEDVSMGAVRDNATYTFLSAGTLTLDGDDPFAIDHDSLLYNFVIPYEDGYDTEAGEIHFIADRLADYSDDEYAKTPNQKAVARAFESARREGWLENLTPAYEQLLSDILHDDVSASEMEAALEQLNPEPYQAAFRMTSGQAHSMARQTMQSARHSRLKMATGTGENLGAMLNSSFSIPGFDPGALGRALDAWAGFSPESASRGRAWIAHDEMGVSAADSLWRGFYGAYGQLGEIDTGTGRSGYDFRSGGLIIGAERSVRDSLVAGASIGYGTGSIDFDQNDGELEMKSLRIGPHVTWVGRNLEVDVAASAGVHFNRQERQITSPVNANPSSRFKSYDGSVFTETRYRMNFARTWDIIPAASLHYSWQYRENHTERGAGDAALRFDSATDDSLRSRLGFSVLRPFSGQRFVVVPEVFAGWGYEILDEDLDVGASFANAPGSGFRVTGEGPGRHGVIYGAGLSALFGEYNVAFARYEREDLEEGSVDTFSLGVKWNF